MSRAYDNAADARFQQGGRRNLIINGNFDVWQRGTSFTADNAYTADRWQLLLSGGTATVTRETFTNGQTEVPGEPHYYLKQACSVGNGNCGINHRVEDVRNGAGQTVTLSFWAKGTNPAGGSFNLQLWQRFGTSGSSTVTDGDQSLVLTSTWTKYTFNWDLGSISGKTVDDSDSNLQMLIRQPEDDDGSAAWELNLAQVQLELGNVATPFEHRSYGEELASCQRYFQSTYEQGVAPGTATLVGGIFGSTSSQNNYAAIPVQFPVKMRAAPSVTTYDDDGNADKWHYAGNNRSTIVSPIGSSGGRVYVDNVSVGGEGSRIGGHYTADAEL